jgi:5-methylcytosine-specific restriction endonuclease McrA
VKAKLGKRFVAKSHTCPKCFAPPDVPCESKDGRARSSVHRERLKGIDSDLLRNMPFRPSSEFYSSDAWRRVRYQALKKNGGACQLCGDRPRLGKPIHVDHIKPRSKFPDLALDVNNLQILCADCNLGKGAADATDWRNRA